MGLLSKAQANAAKRQARRAAERAARQAAARQSAGATVGDILQQSQDFTEGQIQQTRDRGSSSQVAAQAAFAEYGDDVLAAYMGGIMPSSTDTGTTTTTTTSEAPGWIVPAAIVGAGGLWLASRKK